METKRKIVFLSALFVIGILLVGLTIAKPNDRAQKACRDGIDNDGDGYVDLDAPGCRSKNDISELNSGVECDDGIDNDGDNSVDYNDAGCSGPTDNDETNCGDSVCEGGETQQTCLEDCGYPEYCGDGTCNANETQQTCPEDCGYPFSCHDTDGGFSIDIQGTVIGYNGINYTYTDYCSNNITLTEYYCLGNEPQSYELSCNMSYCHIGRCV